MLDVTARESAEIADTTDDSVASRLVSDAMNLLPVTGVVVMTVRATGEFQIAAASSEAARLLAHSEVQQGTGPSLQALRSGLPVSVEDLTETVCSWPEFAELASAYRFKSACAVPLSHHDERLGVLILFRDAFGPMTPYDLAIAQALTGLGTIGFVRERTLSQSESLNQRLQTALNTRVVIEQAKGVLAERGSIDVGEAFTLLRSHARNTRQRLSEVAQAVVNGDDTSAMFSIVR